ncbi:MAG: SMI1/KNR4 family protein [bacterium]
MKLIESIIPIINLQTDRQPNKFIFPKQKNVNKIEQIEKKLNIFFPTSYKEFMKLFDGGFINLLSDLEDIGIEDAKWNSNYLFSLDEVKQEYINLKAKSWKFTPEGNVNYPFVPFCRSQLNELLVFVNPLLSKESYIFEAVHDVPYKDWNMVFFEFSDFLSAYIDEEGDIDFFGENSDTTLSDYLNNFPYTRELYFK